MPAALIYSLEWANFCFTLVFTFEAIIKIIAMRKNYFKDSWNLFDFCVVLITWVVQIIVFARTKVDIKILGTIVRTLRICRIFRIAKRVPQL